MSNNKKNTPYFTSQDKSLIAPPLSKRRAAVEKIVKAYRQHKRKTSDDVAFDNMLKATPELSIMESDKTRADLSGYKADKSTADVHKALMAAGMTPAIGNVADLTDATLYALEGELGNAAWSAAAAIPIIGQMVSGKRALKAAKEAGEEMVTFYRGVDKWFPGKMVKKGKFVGGGQYDEGRKIFASKKDYREWGTSIKSKRREAVWVTSDKDVATGFGRRGHLGDDSNPLVLEFEVPKSYIKKYGTQGPSHYDDMQIIFEKGIPKEFLKKVHK